MDTKMNIKKTSCLEFFKTDFETIQIGEITWSSEIINPLSDPVDYQMAKNLIFRVKRCNKIQKFFYQNF